MLNPLLLQNSTNMNVTECSEDVLLNNILRYDTLAGKVRFTFPLSELEIEREFAGFNRVLDFGCGDGRAFPLLRNCRIRNISALDTSPRMCALAKAKDPLCRVDCVRHPRAPDLPSSAFDGVLLIGVLSSIVPDAERRAAINAIARSLRQSGIVIAADFGRSNLKAYRSRYRLAPFEPFTFKTAEHIWIHHFSCEELADLFSQGFKIQKKKTIDVWTIHGNRVPGHILIAQKVLDL